MKILILLSSATASLIASLVAGPNGAAKAPAAQPNKPMALVKKEAAPKPPAQPPAADATGFTQTIKPFLEKNCVACHGGKRPQAGLKLDAFTDEATAMKDRGVWEKVLVNVRSRTMPPPGFPRPADAEMDLFTGWIDQRLVQITQAECGEAPNPGRVTMRRLNRSEYRNTIRDLTGVNFKAIEDFPSDDVGYGFDNIGDVLSLPPLLMEKYVTAAEKIVAEGYPKLSGTVLKGEKASKENAGRFLTTFAGRAYRRPATEEEVKRLLSLVEVGEKHGGSFDEGMKLAIQAVLCSPYFLFRVERDSAEPAPSTGFPVGDYELASRLSYFLWNSAPDDTLLTLAGNGTLKKPEVLEAQVRRMLRDRRVRGFVESFGGQWLQTRRLKSMVPDPDVFPNFDEPLRAAMLEETDLFFESILKEDRSVLDLLDGNYTFLNERLAKHYGVPGVKGPLFRRVVLKDDRRGGVLTQASILTLTSNPTRTSPVKRGKWILEQFLNDSPPPPPPDAGELDEDQKVVASASLRERMAQHRADPKCASCHSRMDPLGFAFENFDGIGQWRTQDGKFPVEPAGQLPDGTSFKNATELKTVLKGMKKEFSRALTEKMLTFALGRGMERYDRCTVDRISAELAKNNYKMSSLVLGVVRSEPFQKRSPEAVDTKKVAVNSNGRKGAKG